MNQFNSSQFLKYESRPKDKHMTCFLRKRDPLIRTNLKNSRINVFFHSKEDKFSSKIIYRCYHMKIRCVPLSKFGIVPGKEKSLFVKRAYSVGKNIEMNN